MGRFLIGFVVGVGIGATTVILTTPMSGEDMMQFLNAKVETALEVGRKAAAEQEQKLWEEFHEKLKQGMHNSDNDAR